MNLRAHAPSLFGVAAALVFGWWIFPELLYTSIDQPIQFNHAAHVASAGLSCTDCHTIGEKGRFAGLPTLAQCTGCHAEAIGETEEERLFVENHVKTDREVAWHVYARQPDNVFFSHSVHTTVGGIECKRCHGPHGETTFLRPYVYNRVSGYSRDIWGSSISGIPSAPWDGMDMDQCIRCHATSSRRSACLDCHK